MRTRTTLGLATLAIGLLLLTAAWMLWPDPTAGEPEAIVTSLEAPTSTPTPIATPGPTEPEATTTTQIPLWQDAIATTGPGSGIEDGPAPVGLRIERLRVDSPVQPYGVNTRSGQMDVPRNVTEVAWYKHGPSPGQPGSAVLAAHVDLSDQGPGVFFNLNKLQPGDQVWVVYDDGTEASFTVSARQVYNKADLPVNAIFSRSGPAVLTLITCGGGFSESAQSYDSNVVVYAVPSDGVPPDDNGLIQ